MSSTPQEQPGRRRGLALAAVVTACVAGTSPSALAQPALDVPDGTPWVEGTGWNTKDTMLRRNLRREVKYTIEDIVELYLVYDHYRDLFSKLWPLGRTMVDDFRGGPSHLIDDIQLPMFFAGLSLPDDHVIYTNGITGSPMDVDGAFAAVFAPDPLFDAAGHADQAERVANQVLVTAQGTLLSAYRHAEELEQRNDYYLEELMEEVRTALPRTRGMEELQADLDAFITQEYFLLEHSLMLLGNLKAIGGASETFWDAQSAVRRTVEAPAATGAVGTVVVPPAPGPIYGPSPVGGDSGGE